MKNKIIVIICICMLMGTITGEIRISASESGKEFVEGEMHLNGLEFQEETVIFSESGKAYFSLDKFFEGIGGKLAHNETTKEVWIDYLNDMLLWIRGCMRREKNSANIKTSFMNDWFPLGQMTEAGTGIIYEGRIYLSSDTFRKMQAHLGFGDFEIDSKDKLVKLSLKTVNNDVKGGGAQHAYIVGNSYDVHSLADGTYEVIVWPTIEESKNGEKTKKLMLIDEEGHIYKKTDYVMKAPTTSLSSNKTTPVMHKVDTMDGVWQEGTAYFYNLKFPKGTVLYDTPKGTLIYLRSFFEGIGSEVIYDEETKDVKINHINQVLLWEKSEEENTFTIRRSVNPSNVKIDSADGYFKLGDEKVEGWYTRIDGRTYMDLESFKRMVSYLGYRVEDNTEAKELRISPVTLLNWDTISNQPTFENVIDGKRYNLSPLSDGSWIGRRKSNSRSVAYVDGGGQVYELTNQAVDGSLADKNRR